MRVLVLKAVLRQRLFFLSLRWNLLRQEEGGERKVQKSQKNLKLVSSWEGAGVFTPFSFQSWNRTPRRGPRPASWKCRWILGKQEDPRLNDCCVTKWRRVSEAGVTQTGGGPRQLKAGVHFSAMLGREIEWEPEGPEQVQSEWTNDQNTDRNEYPQQRVMWTDDEDSQTPLLLPWRETFPWKGGWIPYKMWEGVQGRY